MFVIRVGMIFSVEILIGFFVVSIIFCVLIWILIDVLIGVEICGICSDVFFKLSLVRLLFVCCLIFVISMVFVLWGLSGRMFRFLSIFVVGFCFNILLFCMVMMVFVKWVILFVEWLI